MRWANDLASPLLVTAAFALPVAAQWVHYPTAGVPRGPDGKPNLSAPAPRDAHGHPDLSELWGAESNVPCPPDGCADLPLNASSWTSARAPKVESLFSPGSPPSTRNARPIAAKTHPPRTDCPTATSKCNTTPCRKVVQIPSLLAILNEHDAFFRQIYSDGRPLPSDPQPSWRGYSSENGTGTRWRSRPSLP